MLVGDWISLIRMAVSASGDSFISYFLLLLPPAWLLTARCFGGSNSRPSLSCEPSGQVNHREEQLVKEGQNNTTSVFIGDAVQLHRPPFAPTAPLSATMVFGGLLMIASEGVLLGGFETGFFAAGLALLGVGWALTYVSASASIMSIFMREPHLRQEAICMLTG